MTERPDQTGGEHKAEPYPVTETAILVPTDDGRADGFLYMPEGAGPWPAIIHYTDGIGLRDAYRAMAARLAAEGYVVLLPNIYYRSLKGPAFAEADLVDGTLPPAMVPRFQQLSGLLDPAAMERDARAYDAYLDARPETGGGVGVIGYSVSGKMALRTAAALPNRIAVAAIVYGDRLYVEGADSPHLALDRVTALLLIAYAQNDPLMPDDMVMRFESALSAWAGRFDSATYPAPHGWAVPGRPIHDAVEAERLFGRVREVFGAALR